MALPHPPPIQPIVNPEQHVQQELEIYLAEKGIQQLLVRLVEKLLLDRPDNAIEYMISYVLENYPEQTQKFQLGGALNQTLNSLNASRVQDDSLLSEEDIVVDVPEGPKGIQSPSKRPSLTETRRGSISAAPLTDSEREAAPVVFDKPEGEIQDICENLLPKHWVTANLGSEEARQVATSMEPITFEPGDVIIQQGDEQALHYFAIKSGTCVLYEGQEPMFELHEGRGFGELALLYNQPRCASVVAQDQVTCYRLDRTTFRVILVQSAISRRERYLDFLQQVPLLVSIDDRAKKTVADALQAREYQVGSEVIRQGEKGNEFFIIEQGKVEVTHQGQVVDTLTVGAHFGEIALLDSSSKRQTTVRVIEGPLKVVFITREVFFRVLGKPLLDSMRKQIPKYKRASNSVGNTENVGGGTNSHASSAASNPKGGSSGGGKRKQKRQQN